MNLRVLKSAALALSMAMLLVSCGGRKVERSGVYFSPVNDPVCDSVLTVCKAFNLKGAELFSMPVSNAKVMILLDRKSYQDIAVKVIDTYTSKVVYERRASKNSDGSVNITFAVYDAQTGKARAEFSGQMARSSLSSYSYSSGSGVDWKNDPYQSFLNRYSYTGVRTGDIQIYQSGSTKLSSDMRLNDFLVSSHDYWPNGQVWIEKTYDRTNGKLTMASNFREDGTPGPVMELISLLNDRWLFFSCNLYSYGDPMYLVLRADRDDWRHGGAVVVTSSDKLQKRYYKYAKANYYVDEYSSVLSLNNIYREYAYGNSTIALNYSGNSRENFCLSGYFDDGDYAYFTYETGLRHLSTFKRHIRRDYKNHMD